MDDERHVAKDHDPDGTDLARRITRQVQGIIPPPRQTAPRRPQRRRRRPATSEPRGVTSLSTALNRYISRRGWKQDLGVRMMLTQWEDLVGAVTAQHTKPETFRDGVLVIRCARTSWAVNLKMMAPKIVAKLNDELGEGTVERIELVGPQAPSWRHGSRSVPGRGPRDTYG